MKSPHSNVLAIMAIVALVCALMGFARMPVVSAVGPTPEAEHEDEHASLDVIPPIEPVSIPAGGKLKVAATTATVAYVVGQVGGEAIDLTGLMERGQDSHTYQPVPRDVAAMVDADLLFINGAGLEEFMHKVMDNIEGDVVIVPVSAGVELLAGHHEHGHDEESEHDAEHETEAEHVGEAHEWDPHTWTSPANVLIWVDNVEHALSAADPANAASYKANADAYRSKLAAVDEWAQQAMAQLPPEKRKIVTNHEAWNYFAEHYGLEQIGAVIPAVSTSVEPSAKEFVALAEALESAGVDVIFVDYEVNPQLSQTMADTIGARVVRIWHELSPEGQGADTYEDWLRFNVNQFVENLK